MELYWILRSYLLRCVLFIAIVRTEEVFNTTPSAVRTNFSCFNRPMGFYADVETNCKVYYMCDDHGNKFSYRCPEETAFRQDASICDHAHLVDCQATIYPMNQYRNENIDKNNATSSTKPPIPDSFDNRRMSFSRSFQVIQPPSDKSALTKLQSGFVFSASLFLRDQDRKRDQITQQIADTSKIHHADSKNRVISSTARALTNRFDYSNTRNDKSSSLKQPQSLLSSETGGLISDKNRIYLRRSFQPISNPSSARSKVSDVTQRPPFHERLSLNQDSNYHPYSETLRSMQAKSPRLAIDEKFTTEIPVHALTLSLKPLIPNELEYDPYYPKQPTSTEAYYTSSYRNSVDTNVRLSTSSQAPIAAAAHFNIPFEIPSVLPDLNTLEDLVDRRKFFYIPRVKSI